MSWYVQRGPGGTVTGLWANRQSGRAEELLADDDAEVLAYEAANAPGGSAYVAQAKAVAKALLTDPDHAQQILERCVARMVLAEFRKVENFCNGLRLRLLNVANPLPAALSLPTWADVLAAIRNQVDGETDPNV